MEFKYCFEFRYSSFGFHISMSLKILFIGDIVGKLARTALTEELPKMKKKYKPDFVIANGENAAHGLGISEKIFKELLSIGIDFVTLGDHAFDKEEIAKSLDTDSSHIIRPYNFSPGVSGSGASVIEVGTKKVLIVNLLGRVFMKMNFDCPFRAIDAILEKYKNEKLSAIIIDFHAETTSEKKAFGWYVDGRVSAVFGTHTHVPTCDHWVMPKGTAYVTDAGMVGPRDSIIGRKIESTLPMFLTQKSMSYEPVEEGVCLIHSVMVEIDTETMQAKSIERLDKEIEL
ncbi:MAG: hypothetical protein US74_C0006G0048 [Parcubacteria group bacterium GW2011_GWA2_38_13]|nr:MAG: hypothetical protein US74_C0006G0048 [Parcubacteria group bacterium GW2011_GWA2_38_13]